MPQGALHLQILFWASALLLALPHHVRADHPFEMDEEANVLTVSAVGRERVSATLAAVRLAVEERGETHESARARMVERVGTLLDYLRRAEVDRLETASLQLHPIHDYTVGERPVVGYQASVVVSFRVEVPEMASVIDAALGAGANQVREVVFTAPEDTIEEARREAARSAAGLALDRADTVLEALELDRREIHRIHLSTQDDQPPVPPVRRLEMRDDARDTGVLDLEAGEHEISATVTLEIRYR